MGKRIVTAYAICVLGVIAIAPVRAGVSVPGRVVDETGAPVSGARVEARTDSGPAARASSDLAGNFALELPSAGPYSLRAERLGFYALETQPQALEAGRPLLLTLNHLQEFHEQVEVRASSAVMDAQQPADRKELTGAEIQAVPYPGPQDYRNALPLMNGVVQDNSGLAHVNGGEAYQTSYTLNGFNMADPVTGRLEARVNVEAIQTMALETSRYSADNGRGSSGALDLRTRMGDDHWRFGGANFIPGVSSDGGFRISKWTPRVEASGPLRRNRAWFHTGLDAFYANDVVRGLPDGRNRTRGLTTTGLSRLQWNLRPDNIFTASLLVNGERNSRYGLTLVNPEEATSTHRRTLYLTSFRDQHYYRGALVEVGFADTRTALRDTPLGSETFQITPFGNRGNYFVNMERHAYRQQWVANLFLPALLLAGEHRLQFGVDAEREAFHQRVLRHPYQIIRDDNTVARQVSFAGSPFQARKNLEAAYFAQDHWVVSKALSVEAGLRLEWNEIVRELEVAPRLAAAWAPGWLGGTKLSAGAGVYYDTISLSAVSRQQDQSSYSTFFAPGAPPAGPLVTSFRVEDRALETPRVHMFSAGAERELPGRVYAKLEYLRRNGSGGLTFAPDQEPGVYSLTNARRDRYDALDVSFRQSFRARYEWFAGYTWSHARTNAAMDYSLENPIFAPQTPGALPWDATHRFHAWGWAPLPATRPRFLTRNTSVATLVEYRTGFPFNVQDEEGFLVGAPGSRRLPYYFNVNLHLERRFEALNYQWAWRAGFNNLTNSRNPNSVNNVVGSPAFLAYGRGQGRAFAVRLRFLGRK